MSAVLKELDQRAIEQYGELLFAAWRDRKRVFVFGNDGSAAWCTVGQPSRFFSHRRDRIGGRFAAAVWRV